MSSRAARTLPIFRRDIERVLAWSRKHFGNAAADRYEVLLRQAVRDLRETPLRTGTMTRPELARHAYIYHLRFSRDAVQGQPVKRPRHFIIYRFAGEFVEFGRLLHDSRDLDRHLPKSSRSF